MDPDTGYLGHRGLTSFGVPVNASAEELMRIYRSRMPTLAMILAYDENGPEPRWIRAFFENGSCSGGYCPSCCRVLMGNVKSTGNLFVAMLKREIAHWSKIGVDH